MNFRVEKRRYPIRSILMVQEGLTKQERLQYHQKSFRIIERQNKPDLNTDSENKEKGKKKKK